MVVCSCKVVNDRTVRAAIATGAANVDDLMSCSNAGTGCGGCIAELERFLREEHIAERVPISA